GQALRGAVLRELREPQQRGRPEPHHLHGLRPRRGRRRRAGPDDPDPRLAVPDRNRLSVLQPGPCSEPFGRVPLQRPQVHRRARRARRPEQAALALLRPARQRDAPRERVARRRPALARALGRDPPAGPGPAGREHAGQGDLVHPAHHAAERPGGHPPEPGGGLVIWSRKPTSGILRRIYNREEGMALVLVVGSMLLLMSFLLVGLTYAMSSTKFSRQNQDYLAAMAAAQAGIDDFISRLNADDL